MGAHPAVFVSSPSADVRNKVLEDIHTMPFRFHYGLMIQPSLRHKTPPIPTSPRIHHEDPLTVTEGC